MKYVILGDPVPLARHRHSGKRTWDSQKQVKLIWGIDIGRQHQKELGETKYTGPIHFDVTFFISMPKTSLKRQKEMSGSYHIFTPDLSNLIKFVEDAATGVIFDNDCIIASITSRKVYDENPRTEFSITTL